MKRISIFCCLLVLSLSGWGQNPAWSLPQRYFQYIGQNSFAVPNLPQPATWCNNGVNPNQPNYEYDGYDGQLPDYSSNMVLNPDGEVEFFIVDGIVYDGEGNYINTLQGNIGVGTGASETLIVPDPANCHRYYIIAVSILSFEKQPNVYLLDMSLPNETGCTDCDHYGALVLQSCPGSSFQDYHLPVRCVQPGFVPSTSAEVKTSNCYLAASELQPGGFYWVFISNSYGIYRFKIDGSGFQSDNHFIPFGQPGWNPAGTRSEMELVALPGGGFRLATVCQPGNASQGGNIIWEYLFVADLDANANFISSTDLRIPMFLYSPGGIDQSAAIKGIEFSENGDRVYFTHSTTPLNPNAMEYYQFGPNPSGPNPVNLPADIDAEFSGLELRSNDRLVLANQNGLYQMNNATSANPNNPGMAPMWMFSYAPTHEGLPNSHFHKMYNLPDQIDGMDYAAHFSANLACCIDNASFEADRYEAASGSWAPNTTFNGGQNPLQPNVSADIYIREELRIPANVNLTISNMVLHFAPEARLVIENGANGQQGGVLNLENTTLTVDDRCSEDVAWLGVEVWGNTNELQGTLSNSTQGRLFMTENSRIEHARIGVLVGKRNHIAISNGNCPPEIQVQPFSFDYGRTGGIVRATESTFLGNQRGVYWLPYFASNGVNNLGRMERTEFVWDGLLRGGYSPQQHAYLRQVKGIYFNGCKFQNASPSLFPYTQLGTGIFSYRAQFYVRQHCSTLTLPCETCSGEVRSSFENLQFGIRTYNPDELTFSCVRSDFTNCQYGVYAMYTDRELLRWNKMDVRQANYQTAGIVLRYSTDFVVEENDIQGLGGPQGSQSYGIVVHQSDTLQNEVYLNRMADLYIGGQSEKINAIKIESGNEPGQTGFRMSGLNWTCNHFESEIERADLTVVDGRIDFFQGHAIGHNSVDEAVEGSARNRFSLHGEALNDEHDLTLSGPAIQELQYVGLNSQNFWVDSYTISDVLPLFSLYNGTAVAATGDMCPSNCQGKIKNQELLADLRSEVSSLEAQFSQRPMPGTEARLRMARERLELLVNRMVAAALTETESMADLQSELADLDATEVVAGLQLIYGQDLSEGSDEPEVDAPEAFLPLEEGGGSEKASPVHEDIAWEVYPNPSNGHFNLRVPEGECEVRVTDLMGRVLVRKQVAGEGTHSLSLGQLPSGIYCVSLWRAGQHSGMKKIEILRD